MGQLITLGIRAAFFASVAFLGWFVGGAAGAFLGLGIDWVVNGEGSMVGYAWWGSLIGGTLAVILGPVWVALRLRRRGQAASDRFQPPVRITRLSSAHPQGGSTVSDDNERTMRRDAIPEHIRSRDFDGPPADDPPDEPVPMDPPEQTGQSDSEPDE